MRRLKVDVESWDNWRTLLQVVRSGTVADAARALGVDPTTAGRRLRRLEARLSRRLLERRGARLEPTAACTELVPFLEQAEAALSATGAAAGLQDGTAGWRQVRVTAVPFLCDYLLAPALDSLLAGHRGIGVELIADERNLSLTRRQADLALRLGPPAGSQRDARQIGTLRYAVYARAGCDPEVLPWAALDAAQAHLPETRFVERAAGRRGVRHRASRMQTLCALAVVGAARTVLPQVMGDRHPALVQIGPPGVVSRPLWVIGHPEERASHVARTATWIETIVTDMDRGTLDVRRNRG